MLNDMRREGVHGDDLCIMVASDMLERRIVIVIMRPVNGGGSGAGSWQPLGYCGRGGIGAHSWAL